MNPLIGMITSQLGGEAMKQISQQIGASPSVTESAVGNAVPLLLSAIGSQASTPGGLEAIQQVMGNTNNSGILENIAGFIGNGQAGGIGGTILNQVLGSQVGNLTGALSSQTGIDQGAAGNLLGILTPIILGLINRQGLDIGTLGQLLSGGDVMNAASKILDADGDGNVMDDVANIVGKFF
jgi:hypothetical protein